MPKLTFKCHEETNEVSPSDSPYFLVYVGDAQNQTSVVKVVRNGSWDDEIDEGDSGEAKNLSFPGIGKFDLVLIALLEEDWDPDFHPAFNNEALGKLKAWMKNIDSLLQPATVQTPSVFNIFKQEFTKAINNHSTNDDLLGVIRFTPGNSTKHFFGGGGHYEVKFQFN